MSTIKFEIKTRLLFKIAFYFIWGGSIIACCQLEYWGDAPDFITKDYQSGFVFGVTIQIIFGILRWLIFDRYPKNVDS